MRTAVRAFAGRRTRCVALAGAIVVVAGGCGGSSPKPRSAGTSTTAAPPVVVTTTTTTVPAPTTTAGPLPAKADDAARAKGVLLRASDLPGYKAGSSTPSSYVNVYGKCTGSALMPAGRTGRSAAQGPFVLDETAAVRAVQTTAVSSFAVFADNAAAAHEAVASLAKPEVGPCAAQALVASVGSPTPPAAAPTTVALPALNLGEESAALRTTIPGAAATQYFDLTVVRKGRVLAYLFVVRLSKESPPEPDRQRLAAVLVTRMP